MITREVEFMVIKAEYEHAKLMIPPPPRPPSRNTVEEKQITRCPDCDRRVIPSYPHQCRRAAA